MKPEKQITKTLDGDYSRQQEKKDNVLSFKDEGGFFTTKLTKEGEPAQDHVMYEWGTLKELTFLNKKECIKFAKGKGLVANFDF